MKYVWLIILCILVVLGCVGQEQSPTPESEPPPGSGMYKDLTDDEIIELIEQNPSAVLYFYSPTCATCQTVKPLLEQLQREYHLDIIWVDKMANQQIFDMYHLYYYPALYVARDSEVVISFDENDSLTRIYSHIMDKTIVGMYNLDYHLEEDQIIISLDSLSPETLYYIDHEDQRLFLFISSTNLFVFSGSQTCETNWLYLKKELIYDGENRAQWEKDSLIKHGGECGELVLVPHSITGSAIVVSAEDISG